MSTAGNTRPPGQAHTKQFTLLFLTKDNDMSHLQHTVTLEQVLQWDLEQAHTQAIKAAFPAKPAITLAELLATKVHPQLMACAVLRPEFLSEKAMRHAARHLARLALKRLRHDGVYIDFRTDWLLEALDQQALGEISAGAVAVARERAMQARRDVALLAQRLGDARITSAAALVPACTMQDAREAGREVMFRVTTLFNKPHEQAAWAEHLLDALIQATSTKEQ